MIDYSGRSQATTTTPDPTASGASVLGRAHAEAGGGAGNEGENEGENASGGGGGPEPVLRGTWKKAWVLEQVRRADFEKRLQANEAWWPAALAVMGEAQGQNHLLVRSLQQRLRLEKTMAEGLGDIALAAGLTPAAAAEATRTAADDHRSASWASSSSSSSSTVADLDDSSSSSSSSSSSKKKKKEKKDAQQREELLKAHMAAMAATAAATADLTPGRVLALLGADAASEALRRNRAAAASHAALLEDRLRPMVSYLKKFFKLVCVR